MKKIILTAYLFLALAGISQENKTWRLGIQWGPHGNPAKFEGGMSEANARFNYNKAGGVSLNLIGRYDYNHRWMVMTGLGFNSYGFKFGIAEDYSLLQKNRNYSSVETNFGALEIPVLLFYKFAPNCKNARWLVGAGFTENFIGAQSSESFVSQSNDGPSNLNYLSTTSTVSGGNYIMLRWAVAREKLYSRGSILNASLVCNIGFDAIAHATVNYNLDNKDYTHTFSNNGSFVGVKVAYYFRPFFNPWKNPASKKTTASVN